MAYMFFNATLKGRIIASTSLVLCSAAPSELLSPFGDCSGTASLSRLPLMASIASTMFKMLCSPSLFMVILPYPCSCIHSKTTLQILPSPRLFSF